MSISPLVSTGSAVAFANILYKFFIELLVCECH